MKYSPVLDRLSGLGGAKWEIHAHARARARQGHDVIELTIGNPDVAAPAELIEAATAAMRAGRTQYSSGRGEEGLREALAARYTESAGRPIGADQVLCFPGTQTALYAVLMGLAEPDTEVLVGDPMYATYEGVVAASGAALVPVPLRSERGFRIAAEDIAARITPQTRAVLLNTPHNPTGAVLRPEDIDAIGRLAVAHDLWLIVDEVYEELVFDGVAFTSPLARADLAERVVVVSSISKSHAAPGFRSGWCIGSAAFTERLLPLSESMLFGNQPFIADMTALAVSGPSEAAAGMRHRFAARAKYLAERLTQETRLRVHRPEAGMFALIDVAATGMSDRDYALDLIESGVAVMPGSAFGQSLAGWVRVALTVDDDRFRRACDRIVTHANAKCRIGA
ncbi:pyridoxal phosphate-dependent aminotransferase [Defluviimonas sp. D31]|uniref:pyridoxal phosphate-dependent aminotransferase n=1 Tax=Defluviimonas sp. D31 TaxID=3083253 RepID=UPI00296F6040|nr:pyridoxal phosphate-dependent aminotransferase [Defluviimonas sp. D31]MDW4550112.1 pyridoxal phosphate-dependent aminotransferase [Defluviimonas sp. D31]